MRIEQAKALAFHLTSTCKELDYFEVLLSRFATDFYCFTEVKALTLLISLRLRSGEAANTTVIFSFKELEVEDARDSKVCR